MVTILDILCVNLDLSGYIHNLKIAAKTLAS